MTQEPFTTRINKVAATLEGHSDFSSTVLKDMMTHFRFGKEITDDTANTEVYRVYKRSVPTVAGELLQCLTILRQGSVRREFFMTRGHNHSDKGCAEIYQGVTGYGLVLMQQENRFEIREINPGTSVYIPAGWSHRTVNTSVEKDLVFYSVWPAQSGYEYDYVTRYPFSKQVVEDIEGYRLISDNESW
ncbi:MAG: glucose-6-phosphate isomerase [Candidatus Thiodiazotropha sp. (ex Rostrolucina anterorostrata)]|nr:glucose-6-phosphate isomerase [Candidatus Thiodiazotropha sp. (ex Rostrolucina anterorostrata)]